VWHGSHLTNYLFGRSQRGDEFIGSTTEALAGAGGARHAADGIDVGGEIPNPISRIANVETNEARYPIRYLFRRRMMDSGGAGRFRGGTGGEYAFVPHDSPDGGVGLVLCGKGIAYPMGQGLEGGYPGAPGCVVLVEGNAAEGDGGAAAGRPLRLEDLCGERRPICWGVFRVAAKDALYIRWNGAGGYGDPLDRAPDSVARDVAIGAVSPAAARHIYGVVLDGAGGLDAGATETARAELRSRRVRRRGEPPARPLSPFRGIDRHEACASARCRSCGHPLCAAGGPWKAQAALQERPLSRIAAVYTTAERVVLREFCCPCCAALLDAEIALPEDPFLDDTVDL
jgi:N-methylhydantoinase B